MFQRANESEIYSKRAEPTTIYYRAPIKRRIKGRKFLPQIIFSSAGVPRELLMDNLKFVLCNFKLIDDLFYDKNVAEIKPGNFCYSTSLNLNLRERDCLQLQRIF